MFQNKFIKGAAEVLILFPNTKNKELETSFYKDDLAALSSDWAMVEEDLKKSYFNLYKQIKVKK